MLFHKNRSDLAEDPAEDPTELCFRKGCPGFCGCLLVGARCDVTPLAPAKLEDSSAAGGEGYIYSNASSWRSWEISNPDHAITAAVYSERKTVIIQLSVMLGVTLWFFSFRFHNEWRLAEEIFFHIPPIRKEYFSLAGWYPDFRRPLIENNSDANTEHCYLVIWCGLKYLYICRDLRVCFFAGWNILYCLLASL